MRPILDSVTRELARDPAKRFMYVETAFFSRWFDEQDADTQEMVRELVAQGRLEMVNGGWCMHDEAAANYVGMIDQTTLGHRYLKEKLGAVPTVTWQIDPFGHAGAQASLLSAEAGFDALFFGRTDYQDRARRSAAKELEMVWRGSGSLGSSAEVFTGAFSSGNYGPPEGFDWGGGCSYLGCDEPVQDNPKLENFNVGRVVDKFVARASEYASQTRGDSTNHTMDVMFTMGSDFHYSNAVHIFANIDRIIKHVNADGRVEAFYSTPSQYVKARAAAQLTWPLKTHDFFPYADNPHAYWTGYFTSRAGLKRYVRIAQAALQAARQLEFVTGAKGTTEALDEAVGVAQHHDGVSGTAKQHVADDYAKRLADGMSAAFENAKVGMATLAATGKAATAALVSTAHGAAKATQAAVLPRRQLREAALLRPAATVASHEAVATVPTVKAGESYNLTFCELRNVSACPASATAHESPVSVVVYNPTAWVRREVLRVPVASPAVQVKNSSGAVVPLCQFVPVPAATKAAALADGGEALPYEVVFEVEVPPLATTTFALTPDDTPAAGSAVSAVERPVGKAVSIANDKVSLSFDESGRLSTMVANAAGEGGEDIINTVEHDFVYYKSSTGDKAADQKSGAYIFRPNQTEAVRVGEGQAVALEVHEGPLVSQVSQTWPVASGDKTDASWVTAVWRLYKGAAHATLEWTVGPVPIGDGWGKEVVSRLTTGSGASMSKADWVFYTDSAGRDAVERRIDWRPDWQLNTTDNPEPVAGNFYPVNAFIGGASTNQAVNTAVYVVNDRAQAGGSISPGAFELMVQRRLLHDDGRGVGEPLNETRGGVTDYDDNQRGKGPGAIVRGEHLLSLTPPEGAARTYRALAALQLQPLALGFSEGTALFDAAVEATAAKAAAAGADSAAQIAALPDNVQLLTLQKVGDGEVLLRVAHLYAACEDDTLSSDASVDLAALFGAGQRIAKITETTLSSNQVRGARPKPAFAVAGGAGWAPDREAPLGVVTNPSAGQLVVRLVAMEVRTFVLELDS